MSVVGFNWLLPQLIYHVFYQNYVLEAVVVTTYKVAAIIPWPPGADLEILEGGFHWQTLTRFKFVKL